MEAACAPRPWRYGLLAGSYLLFLLLGAAVLAALEGAPEESLRRELRAAAARLLRDHRACLSRAQLEGLLERFVAAGSYGVSGLGNVSGDESWEFTSALFFTASVLTTTGYGHTVPLSDGGKIFCVLYSLLGIPMTMLLLGCLLQHLLPFVSYRPVQYLHMRWGFPLAHVALAHAMLLGLATLGLFILIPAVCFWALEGDWNFLESVYFCFISLSTIGLGDYVPKGSSQPPLHELYEISITCYLLVGLLAMLLTLETAYQLQEVHAVIRFFAPARDSPQEDDDRAEILAGDQFALATVSGTASPDRPMERGAT
uniref:potassium channel subfamily K member 7 n=1 Tax=Euleptes europaea TaxID=460621 RepID=UPI002540155C|nr:potassium channel subfamily K member 7 [Euleptes europaea]